MLAIATNDRLPHGLADWLESATESLLPLCRNSHPILTSIGWGEGSFGGRDAAMTG